MGGQVSEEEKRVWVQSIVSGKDLEPYVQISLDEQMIAQLTPEEARQVARHILETANAAELDAFFVEFLQEMVGVRGNPITIALSDFRKWREERGMRSRHPIDARKNPS